MKALFVKVLNNDDSYRCMMFHQRKDETYEGVADLAQDLVDVHHPDGKLGSYAIYDGDPLAVDLNIDTDVDIVDGSVVIS